MSGGGGGREERGSGDCCCSWIAIWLTFSPFSPFSPFPPFWLIFLTLCETWRVVVGDIIRRTREESQGLKCGFPGWRDDWGAHSLSPATSAMSDMKNSSETIMPVHQVELCKGRTTTIWRLRGSAIFESPKLEMTINGDSPPNLDDLGGYR